MLDEQTKLDFDAWYLKNYNMNIGNEIDSWMIQDQLNCYSVFFGYTIDSITGLKNANKSYNLQHTK